MVPLYHRIGDAAFTLWSFGKEFWLGQLQILISVIALTGMGMVFGFSWKIAFIGAAGFVLDVDCDSDATVNDRGELHQRRGQRSLRSYRLKLIDRSLIGNWLPLWYPNRVAESSSIHYKGLALTVGHCWINCCRALMTNPLFKIFSCC